jgi:hypothetical protein
VAPEALLAKMGAVLNTPRGTAFFLRSNNALFVMVHFLMQILTTRSK